MSLGVSTACTGSGSCTTPPLDPSSCKNHSIPLGDAMRAPHCATDQCEVIVAEALAECLEDSIVYQDLLTDEEAPQLRAEFRSKYAFARKILRSPVTRAISLFTYTSLPRANDSSLEPDSDMKKIEVTGKDPSGDPDWCLVPPYSEPTDLSGAVVLARTKINHGGSYGDVWMASLENGKKKTAVAVKAIRLRGDREDCQRKLQKRLERELRVWQGLSHPNIVPLLGIVTTLNSHISYNSASPAMVSPWMNNGNLIGYMKMRSKPLTESDRLHLLRDVASGLEYLHSQSDEIIHGDLTGANILIDDQGRALLVDFGLSLIKAEFVGTSFWSSTAGGAMRWRAPELLPTSEVDNFVPDLTVACDIFSFGCVMLHTMSGELPYFNIQSSQFDIGVVVCLILGRRPKRPVAPFLTDEYWGLINWCWGKSPLERPTAKEVHLHISNLL